MGSSAKEGLMHDVREATSTLLPLICLPYKQSGFTVLGDYPLRQLTCTDNVYNVGFPLMALFSVFLSTFLRSKPELVRGGFSPITVEVLIVLIRILFVNDHAFRWQLSLLENVQAFEARTRAKSISHTHLNRFERALRYVHLLGVWVRLKRTVQSYLPDEKTVPQSVNLAYCALYSPSAFGEEVLFWSCVCYFCVPIALALPAVLIFFAGLVFLWSERYLWRRGAFTRAVCCAVLYGYTFWSTWMRGSFFVLHEDFIVFSQQKNVVPSLYTAAGFGLTLTVLLTESCSFMSCRARALETIARACTKYMATPTADSVTVQKGKSVIKLMGQLILRELCLSLYSFAEVINLFVPMFLVMWYSILSLDRGITITFVGIISLSLSFATSIYVSDRTDDNSNVATITFFVYLVCRQTFFIISFLCIFFFVPCEAYPYLARVSLSLMCLFHFASVSVRFRLPMNHNTWMALVGFVVVAEAWSWSTQTVLRPLENTDLDTMSRSTFLLYHLLNRSSPIGMWEALFDLGTISYVVNRIVFTVIYAAMNDAPKVAKAAATEVSATTATTEVAAATTAAAATAKQTAGNHAHRTSAAGNGGRGGKQKRKANKHANAPAKATPTDHGPKHKNGSMASNGTAPTPPPVVVVKKAKAADAAAAAAAATAAAARPTKQNGRKAEETEEEKTPLPEEEEEVPYEEEVPQEEDGEGVVEEGDEEEAVAAENGEEDEEGTEQQEEDEGPMTVEEEEEEEEAKPQPDNDLVEGDSNSISSVFPLRDSEEDDVSDVGESKRVEEGASEVEEVVVSKKKKTKASPAPPSKVAATKDAGKKAAVAEPQPETSAKLSRAEKAAALEAAPVPFPLPKPRREQGKLDTAVTEKPKATALPAVKTTVANAAIAMAKKEKERKEKEERERREKAEMERQEILRKKQMAATSQKTNTAPPPIPLPRSKRSTDGGTTVSPLTIASASDDAPPAIKSKESSSFFPKLLGSGASSVADVQENSLRYSTAPKEEGNTALRAFMADSPTAGKGNLADFYGFSATSPASNAAAAAAAAEKDAKDTSRSGAPFFDVSVILRMLHEGSSEDSEESVEESNPLVIQDPFLASSTLSLGTHPLPNPDEIILLPPETTADVLAKDTNFHFVNKVPTRFEELPDDTQKLLKQFTQTGLRRNSDIFPSPAYPDDDPEEKGEISTPTFSTRPATLLRRASQSEERAPVVVVDTQKDDGRAGTQNQKQSDSPSSILNFQDTGKRGSGSGNYTLNIETFVANQQQPQHVPVGGPRTSAPAPAQSGVKPHTQMMMHPPQNQQQPQPMHQQPSPHQHMHQQPSPHQQIQHQQQQQQLPHQQQQLPPHQHQHQQQQQQQPLPPHQQQMQQTQHNPQPHQIPQQMPQHPPFQQQMQQHQPQQQHHQQQQQPHHLQPPPQHHRRSQQQQQPVVIAQQYAPHSVREAPQLVPQPMMMVALPDGRLAMCPVVYAQSFAAPVASAPVIYEKRYPNI